MSDALALLRALVAPAAPETGTVHELRDGIAQVATPRGRVAAVAGAGVRLGDRVQLRGGVAQRVAVPSEIIAV